MFVFTDELLNVVVNVIHESKGTVAIGTFSRSSVKTILNKIARIEMRAINALVFCLVKISVLKMILLQAMFDSPLHLRVLHHRE